MTNAPTAVFVPAGGEADQHAITQLATCMEAGDAVAGVLCADHHVGYSQPIGGAVAYPEAISPSGVGYDIGCGNKAVETGLFYREVADDIPRIMDEITRRISFGMGRPAAEPADHPVLSAITERAPTTYVKSLQRLAADQLGTVGAGNHYVDLFEERESGRLWIGVHFGSRGFGHKVATSFMALAQGKREGDRPEGGEMDSPPILIPTSTVLGQAYIEAMSLAGEYAEAGRDVAVDKVLDILGTVASYTVHNHHNFAWYEETPHGKAWVVRKGCTPLWPGQEGFVGGSMGEDAVIIEGHELPDSARNGLDGGWGDGATAVAQAAAALYSAPHGAGRVMSRTEAKGKINRKTGEVKRKGKVDFEAVKARLVEQGIELRGGDADEAPEAYKRLPAVLEAHEPYVEVTASLRPVGVAMAGRGVKDPFKD